MHTFLQSSKILFTNFLSMFGNILLCNVINAKTPTKFNLSSGSGFIFVEFDSISDIINRIHWLKLSQKTEFFVTKNPFLLYSWSIQLWKWYYFQKSKNKNCKNKTEPKSFLTLKRLPSIILLSAGPSNFSNFFISNVSTLNWLGSMIAALM